MMRWLVSNVTPWSWVLLGGELALAGKDSAELLLGPSPDLRVPLALAVMGLFVAMWIVEVDGRRTR